MYTILNVAMPISVKKRPNLFQHFLHWIKQDWYAQKYFPYAFLLCLLTIISTSAYYHSYPQPELNLDTITYLNVEKNIPRYIFPVDVIRLPGYPFFIFFVYTFAGQGNLVAVGIAQGILFVLATLGIYLIAVMIWQRSWLAFLTALLVGTNLVLLSYVKMIMSEGLSLWLLTVLALFTIYFIRTMRIRAFWLAALCLLCLSFVRPEWIYFPVPLFAYLFLAALYRGLGRRLLRHIVLALIIIYVSLGSYTAVNIFVNHFPGLTSIENINLMGKVLQYNMQDEAPPQYAPISHALDHFIQVHNNRDPYQILSHIPELLPDTNQSAGNFARAVILRHPLEFLAKSIEPLFSSLTAYYDPEVVGPLGALPPALSWLKSIHQLLYNWNICFPYIVLTWLVLLCWQRTRSQTQVLAMGALVLIICYGLIITTLGGYRFDDYMRFHIVFDPLLIFVTWSSILISLLLLSQRVLKLWRGKLPRWLQI